MNPSQSNPFNSVPGSVPGGPLPERLNLLLTCSSWRDNSPISQLPQLLGPFGIRTLTAKNGEDAVRMIENSEIHIAIVDVGIPLVSKGSTAKPGGERVLQLLRRLTPQPPTIVIRPRQSSKRENARGLARSLQEGAFTVVDRPAVLETLLDALHRALRRHYADRWPKTRIGF
ncbi:MAG: hypothetical protein OR996_04840 [Phycisphaerales bacterium]|nr:hypothetical protein [Phycisphaerales bacterium]